MDLNIPETRLKSQVQCTQHELRFMICISSIIYWDGEVVVCCNTKQQLFHQYKCVQRMRRLPWSDLARFFAIGMCTSLFYRTISYNYFPFYLQPYILLQLPTNSFRSTRQSAYTVQAVSNHLLQPTQKLCFNLNHSF